MINGNVEVFIGKTSDLSARMSSTSGGVFYEIAKYIIESKAGVVYGAAFNDLFEVEHICVETTKDLCKLQGSKYPQSRLGKTFIDVKKHLKQGRYVLFSGLPCQVSGLIDYLGEKYENLLCVDLICYGVASPGIWREYLETFWGKKEIKRIVFKDKTRGGWKNWNTLIETKNRRYHLQSESNLYMSGYLKGAFIRPSCEYCKFKGINRKSDITIGDAWGKGESHSLNDNLGLSVILTNSESGRALWRLIQNNFQFEKVEFEDYMKGNPYYFNTHRFNVELFNKFLLSKKTDRSYAFKSIILLNMKLKLKYWILMLKGWEKNE